MSNDTFNILEVAEEIVRLTNDRVNNNLNEDVLINHAHIKKKSPHYPDLNLITIKNMQVYFTNSGDIITIDILDIDNIEYPPKLQRTTLYSNHKLTGKVREQAVKLYEDNNK